jgi:iron complex transport system ATP-binding protein
MTSAPEITARHVTLRVEGRALLDDVSLSLAPGSMTALLGPNGAGKTTLLRTLAGIITPSEGDVELGGRTLRTLRRPEIARACAYLPQQTASRFEMRVDDVVALGRYPHLRAWTGFTRVDHELVEAALDRVGLTRLRHRTLPTLSGGERQRTFLARALTQQAPVLLLDEPMTGLDIGGQLELIHLLKALQSDGHTVLASVHDLRVALECFPRALLLHQGRLVADGPCAGVLSGAPLEAAFGVRVHTASGPQFTSVPGQIDARD